ncbi:MAG: tRNA-dihydrouridine synthase, partial [Dongiaceae bacterium]
VIQALEQSGADGVMIGRGCYGRPWFLRQVMQYLRDGETLPDPSVAEQKQILLDHFADMLDHYGPERGAPIARKHIGWYSKGLTGSAEFRTSVNRTRDAVVVRDLISGFYDRCVERDAA